LNILKKANSGIREALDRARTQKQTSAMTTAARTGELDQRLAAILEAEAELVDLKQRLAAIRD